MDLSNKTIFITGASSGIGRKLSLDAAKAGAKLYITGRDKSKLNSTKGLCCENSSIEIIIADLRLSDEITNLVTRLPLLDGIVLNAGVIDYVPIKLISQNRIKEVFSVNFDSNVLLIQSLLKLKKIKNNSSIVFVSSISAHLGISGTALYAASKAALSAFAKVLASELASKKIRVNIISPGLLRSDVIENNDNLLPENIELAEKEYPLGYGTTSNVSDQTIYLLSDHSVWMTGTDIILDGGYTLK